MARWENQPARHHFLNMRAHMGQALQREHLWTRRSSLENQFPLRLGTCPPGHEYGVKVGSTMSPWMRFVLAVLTTWRVTHLLANEDGPADLIFRFRRLLGQSLAGKLMDCFYCLSLWIATPAALFVTRRPVEWSFTWLALSGAACLLERMVKEPERLSLAPPSGEGEVENVLRSEAFAATEQPGSDKDTGRPTVHYH